MSAEQIISSIESIENEAEKALEEAKSRANEIILKAREEAGRILSSEMPLDEVKEECEQILSKAGEKEDEKVKESKKTASQIRTSAGKKVDKITERIVNIISGAEVK